MLKMERRGSDDVTMDGAVIGTLFEPNPKRQTD